MVPPMSRSPATTSVWSAIVEITGCGVLSSNSAEFAPSSPAMVRAAWMTMHCRPRHRPSVGMPLRWACARAPSLPSMPRMPKPPGTSTPDTPFSAAAAPDGVSHESDATQRMVTRARCAKPPARTASVTER